MKFENAKDGIKKIYRAGIMTLIGSAAIAISAVLALVLSASLEASGNWLSILLIALSMLGSVVLLIVAYILNIIGVRKAAEDENGFKAALLFIAAGIALAVVSAFFRSDNAPVANGIITILGDINKFAVLAFIIQGVRNIADRKNNGAVSKDGQKLLLIALITYALIIVVSVIGFFPLLDKDILYGAGAILTLFITILYLNYLKKALKMLDRK